LLISPELLVAEGLLSPGDLRAAPEFPDNRVDFARASGFKEGLLRKATSNFAMGREFEAFRDRSASWIHDLSLFVALAREFGTMDWSTWPEPIARRHPGALHEWGTKLASEIRHEQIVEFLFDHQWNQMRGKCRRLGIRLIGDVPIFVSYDSADVWCNTRLFQLGDDLRPTAVAGVPPDYFNEDGQFWGNPLYRWEAHAAEGFAWWAGRMGAALNRVDLVRLDHFRGFEAYFQIPADARSAADPRARWVAGPGAAFMRGLRDRLGRLPLIAEDLGAITPGVHALRDDFGLPGMRILQFGFSGGGASYHLPHQHTPHCIAYTGTHDNDTTVGWYHQAPGATTQTAAEVADERRRARAYMGLAEDDGGLNWAAIRVLYASVADTAIVPMQDVLGLGSEARMNRPGIPTGNWEWRLRPGQLKAADAARLAELAEVADRVGGEV
jgi:4-alpha-glucanotransferase